MNYYSIKKNSKSKKTFLSAQKTCYKLATMQRIIESKKIVTESKEKYTSLNYKNNKVNK